MKRQVKYKFCLLQIIFFSLTFVSSLFYLASASIISSHIIAESSIVLAKCFIFLQLHVAEFQTESFSDMCFLHSLWFSWFYFCFYCHSSIDLNYIFSSSNLHLHTHDISFVKIFDSFFSVIVSKTCIFKSFVLFETHTLLDKPLRVLQFPTHFFSLAANE